jgi:hypothetical protein
VIAVPHKLSLNYNQSTPPSSSSITFSNLTPEILDKKVTSVSTTEIKSSELNNYSTQTLNDIQVLTMKHFEIEQPNLVLSERFKSDFLSFRDRQKVQQAIVKRQVERIINPENDEVPFLANIYNEIETNCELSEKVNSDEVAELDLLDNVSQVLKQQQIESAITASTFQGFKDDLIGSTFEHEIIDIIEANHNVLQKYHNNSKGKICSSIPVNSKNQ